MRAAPFALRFPEESPSCVFFEFLERYCARHYQRGDHRILLNKVWNKTSYFELEIEYSIR